MDIRHVDFNQKTLMLMCNFPNILWTDQMKQISVQLTPKEAQGDVYCPTL